MLTADDVLDAHQEQWLTAQLRGPLAGRLALASDPQLSPGVAGRLVRDRSVKVRRALAENRGCPVETLEELAGRGGAVSLRAQNTLGKLAALAEASVGLRSDSDPVKLAARVTEELAAGHALSPELLRDPQLPAEARAQIIDTGRSHDRERLLENPSLTWPEARRIFDAQALRPTAAGHPSPRRMASYYYAGNPAADPGWLAATAAELAAVPSSDGGLGAKVARNPNTQVGALRALLDAGLHREEVLTNANVTSELVDTYAARELARLGGRDDMWARTALQRAAKHPRAARALLVHLPLRAADHLTVIRLLRAHCTSGAHAAAALQLADTFPGSVGELLDLAEIVAADAG